MKKKEMEGIHENLVNGKRQDMVKGIQEYGLYDFFSDYKVYLNDLYAGGLYYFLKFEDFSDEVISYFRITEK